jgi:hypothetical protein
MAAGHRSYRVARLWCARCRATVRARIEVVGGVEVYPLCPGCDTIAWDAPPARGAATTPPPPAAEAPPERALEMELNDDRPVHEVLATPEEVAEFWAWMGEENEDYYRHRFGQFIGDRERALEAERDEVARARARMWRELWDIVGSTG